MGSAKSFMGMFRSRRRSRRALVLLWLCVLVGGLLVYFPLSMGRQQALQVATYDASIAHFPVPRVFIAAMFSSSADVLSRYWIPALIGTIERLGRHNVYVSILENESLDNTREVLLRLEEELLAMGVLHTIRFEEGFRNRSSLVVDGFLSRVLGPQGNDNWIMLSTGGEWIPRRISYLAAIRNMVLEPLRQTTRKFDKVLFINDVIFSVPRSSTFANLA
jgi:Cryptococcal mannosyltransferase 1